MKARKPGRGGRSARRRTAIDPVAGRRRTPATGDRLNRTTIADRLKVGRRQVAKYLALEGAPRPDRKMRFSLREVREWIEKVAPKLPHASDEYRTLKLAMLRMDAEEREIDLAQRKGELVRKKDIEPTITGFMTALTTNLRAKFEFELPAKYEGKTTAERAKLNADAIDWVIEGIRSGARPITT